MYATDFVFDGVNLSSKGYMICTFDGDSIVSGGEIEPIVKKAPSADEYTYYTAQINNVLTWELGICKLPCGTEAFEPLNQYEESELAQFLLKTDGYRWLQFVQPDDYPDVFYKVYINMTPYQIGGQTFGYNLTITSNCGYGFSHEYTATLTDDNQPLTINVNNDLNRYIYPTVSFETNADECWIYNENDLEQNLDNGKESHFYNLGDNVDVLKEISMDSTNDVINGIETPDQFNWNFLRLVNGENNIYADGILADVHYSTTEWETVRDGATLTKNESHTFELAHLHNAGGIVARTAFDYELRYDTLLRFGSASAGETIELDNNATYYWIKAKLKKLIFNLEQEYNYVYLYTVSPYQIELYGSTNRLVYDENEELVQYNYGLGGFDCYTVNIDYITGEISNVTKTYGSKADRTHVENFLYVPTPIVPKDGGAGITIPYKTDYIPEIINKRRTAPLFELNGLPDDYKSEYDFNIFNNDKGIAVLRDDNDNYEIWECNNKEYRWLFDTSGDYLIFQAYDYEELKIYSYDKATKEWSLTYRDTGEHQTYEKRMGINGFFGDVVYLSQFTTILPVYGGSMMPIFNDSNWEIYTGGEFITGGNDAEVQGCHFGTNANDSVWISTSSTLNSVSYNSYSKYYFDENNPLNVRVENAYIYNSNEFSITVSGQGTLAPHDCTFVFLGFVSTLPPITDSGHVIVYELERTAREIPTNTEVCFPLEGAILYTDDITIPIPDSGMEFPVYNIERIIDHTCEITGATQNMVAIEYEKYLPVESQQNATIKYREIRRVLV